MPLPFDPFPLRTRRFTRMDAEQTIAEIEWLERIFAVPDTRNAVRLRFPVHWRSISLGARVGVVEIVVRL
jgi:hypothetical protein